MTQNSYIRGRILSVQKINVDDNPITPSGTKIGDDSVMLNSLLFSGDVYENEHTMTDDLKYRFETTTLKLRGAVIYISEYGVLIGDSENQRYPKLAGNVLSIGDVDLSTIYFKNSTPGQDAKLNILGVRL